MYADEGGPAEEQQVSALHSELQWQRNEVRIFAHAAAETQVAIKDALANKFSATRAGLDSITQSANDPGFLEVFPRVASRPPKLLQELEAILVDRLRANDKTASLQPLGAARDRDPKLSANLSLDGHRQVLAAFVAGFSTYAPLLSRIQAEFDRALNEGVRSAQENVEMRYAMAQNELARERATAEVRGQVLSEDLGFRASALARLQELRERAVRAEKKKTLAEKDLREALAEEGRMRALVEQLRATHTKLTELVAEEERWTTKPLSGHLLGLSVGPLTKEDEMFLEQELGGISDSLVPSPSAITAAAVGASAFRANSLARNPSTGDSVLPSAAMVAAGASSGGAPKRADSAASGFTVTAITRSGVTTPELGTRPEASGDAEGLDAEPSGPTAAAPPPVESTSAVNFAVDLEQPEPSSAEAVEAEPSGEATPSAAAEASEAAGEAAKGEGEADAGAEAPAAEAAPAGEAAPGAEGGAEGGEGDAAAEPSEAPA
ncbi:hypothetical protein HYH03_011003 [Edaphochlamys debaryana]|uniref:Uncharacterized protein n=1 Tax=Edaphochlamys debaryana TaxID=47281 RepID=A0A835XY81_9CHLO|nr:hypothetical protein HYH03_011003 [Edaphochlamys debaryana]|eukprot:KAG2490611.1 hypothetical protein HYH03_011003 [Edaphochlamys debaryana]